MTLTIRYKNGEFTCTFTPDGDASVQITSAGAVMADMGDARPADQGVNPGDENPAGDVEMTVSDQGEFVPGAEEYRLANESDGSPATEPLVDASFRITNSGAVTGTVNNGDQQMNPDDANTAEKAETTTPDQEEDSTGAEKDMTKLIPR